MQGIGYTDFSDELPFSYIIVFGICTLAGGIAQEICYVLMFSWPAFFPQRVCGQLFPGNTSTRDTCSGTNMPVGLGGGFFLKS